MELTVGKKGGGGRVGYATVSNKGPKNLGGSRGAGGRVKGGGTGLPSPGSPAEVRSL